MTIEEFKSFLLTLTDNKPFNLKHMIDNQKTLGDLKTQAKEWSKKFSTESETIEVFIKSTADDKYFDLHYMRDGNASKMEKCSHKTKI